VTELKCVKSYDLVFFCFQKDERNAFKSLGTGNRIATFLFYVSILPKIIIKYKQKKAYVNYLTRMQGHVELDINFFLFISVINQLDAQNICFTISSFHASTCFEHMC